MFQFPIVSENGFNQVAQQLAVFASPCCVAVSNSSPLMLHFWLSKHPRINETSATSCRVWGLGLRCRSTKSPELQVHSVYTVTWSTNRDDMLNASQEYKIQRYTVCSMTQHECVPVVGHSFVGHFDFDRCLIYGSASPDDSSNSVGWEGLAVNTCRQF